jgi:hypothetical protein
MTYTLIIISKLSFHIDKILITLSYLLVLPFLLMPLTLRFESI